MLPTALISTDCRDQRIETLRGFACLLLVAFHVVGGDSLVGMHVADSSWWRTIADLGKPVRMPLFAFLSGYVFIASVGSKSELIEFLRKRTMRLGLPLLTVSPLFALLSCAVGSTFCTASPSQILLYPYAHYWFLQANLILALLVAPVIYLSGMHRKQATLAVFALACVLYAVGAANTWTLFAISDAIALFPFLALGLVFRHWSIASLLNQAAVRALILATMAILAMALWGIHGIPWDARTTQLALSLFLCIFLFFAMPAQSLLAWLGTYSYAIYLFHPVFSSAVRRLLLAVVPTTPSPLLFTIGLLFGVLLPVLLQKLLRQTPLANLLFFGIAPKVR